LQSAALVQGLRHSDNVFGDCTQVVPAQHFSGAAAHNDSSSKQTSGSDFEALGANLQALIRIGPAGPPHTQTA
jgi:hypothetical protein